MLSNILFAASALAGLVAANGHASVRNNCPYDLHYTYNNGDIHILAQGGYYQSPAYPSTGNMVIKMSLSNDFSSGHVLQLEAAATDFVYYDMSEIDGHPTGENFRLVPSDSSCTVVTTKNAYHVDGPRGTLACKTSANLALTPC